MKNVALRFQSNLQILQKFRALIIDSLLLECTLPTLISVDKEGLYEMHLSCNYYLAKKINAIMEKTSPQLPIMAGSQMTRWEDWIQVKKDA